MKNESRVIKKGFGCINYFISYQPTQENQSDRQQYSFRVYIVKKVFISAPTPRTSSATCAGNAHILVYVNSTLIVVFDSPTLPQVFRLIREVDRKVIFSFFGFMHLYSPFIDKSNNLRLRCCRLRGFGSFTL